MIATIVLAAMLSSDPRLVPIPFGQEWEVGPNGTHLGAVSHLMCADGSIWTVPGEFSDPAVRDWRCPVSTLPKEPRRRTAGLFSHFTFRKD